MPGLLFGLALICALAPRPSSPAPDAPQVVTVRSGRLTLGALLWRPPGIGPFPAVMFNHGGYLAGDPMALDEPAALGPVFARHGYVILFLFRRGVGPSAGQGTADGDLMARALAADGVEGRNRVQLHLLETEALTEARAGLAFLRTRPEVDRHRIAVAGQSFGGSLSLLMAARDTTLRAAVVIAVAAGNWEQSPALRARLLTAVTRARAPVLFIHAANDYSVAPGETLAGEMRRLAKPHGLKVYPPAGRTAYDGHNFHYRHVATWEADVFAFLGAHLQRR